MGKNSFLCYNLDNYFFMFVDQNPSLRPETKTAVVPANNSVLKDEKKLLFIMGLVAIVLVMALGGWWYFRNFFNLQKEVEPEVTNEEPVNLGLPGNLGGDDPSNNGNNYGDDNFKSENLTFGSFYQAPTATALVNIKGVKLPLNIKSQVSNYYDTARKINLDPIVNNLNQNGFGVIDNPFIKTSNDFFGIYAELNKKSIPAIVTSDFLLYYYQNSLKQIYKEIEASFFYEKMWRVTDQLYKAANARYQERRQKVGITSDPLLEAERLEAAYFATGLSLLKPENNQINSTEDLNDSTKFKPSEASRFDFSVPGYLTDDLNNEIELIRDAKQISKSPVLLYDRDYKDFQIPEEYSKTAKLRNFYLASRWYTSLFPLYFKDDSCQNCLLDKDDWIINQTAAHLIAYDLSSSQSLKNEWAKIYKVMSFFSGLRSELTYLHYQTKRTEIFKEDSLEDILGVGSFDRLVKMRDELAKLDFKKAEGSYDRINLNDKPVIGMRLLQTFYWPSQFFYNELTHDKVGIHNDFLKNSEKKVDYLTACYNSAGAYRCRGLGFDILNIVLAKMPKSKFILDNINYEKYNAQSVAIKNQLKSFNLIDWHNNNFWTTLSLVGAFVNSQVPVLAYENTEQWLEKKISSTLASLTNLSLPADNWQLALQERSTGNLGSNSNLNDLNYLEPNVALVDELVANTDMLFQALISLGVVKDNDEHFTDLLSKMKTSQLIIKKELAQEELSGDDYQFINDFVSQFKVDKAGSKVLVVNFNDSKNKQDQIIKQTIEPLKLMLLLYEKNGQKILAAGPIFNYKEQ